jgi:hypothetical protein
MADTQSPMNLGGNNMNRILTTLTVLLLLPLAAMQAAGAPQSRIIAVFGDSITAGGALPGKDRDKLWLRVIERARQTYGAALPSGGIQC